MCGFIVTNKQVNIEKANKYCKNRGPDSTNKIKVNGGPVYLHNLLHITGKKIPQPFVKSGCWSVFNGEIYNYKDFGDYQSDGECIIDLYLEKGYNFASELDGEFAIVIIDENKNKLIVSNDTFATKPVWVAFEENYFGVASYKSCLYNFKYPEKFIGNYTKVYDLSLLNLVYCHKIKEFDLNQHKNTYDDWINAFEKSIAKRTCNTDYGIFLGLSSGYDSGGIACELKRQNKKFKAFTIVADETRKILESRHELLKENESNIIWLTRNEYKTIKKYIRKTCEDFVYEDQFNEYNIKNDKASFGLAKICQEAKKENYRVYLSGQGSDEILSDYGFNGKKFYSHSEFGGLFPDNLILWHSFFDGTQIKYLNKEEYIAGHYGIETRYPYLDVDLVQEFLWLKPVLKNKYYKAPLRAYLEKNKYPYEEGVKKGFGVNRNLRR